MAVSIEFIIIVLLLFLIINSIDSNVPILRLWKPFHRKQKKIQFWIVTFLLFVIFAFSMIFWLKTLPVKKEYQEFMSLNRNELTKLIITDENIPNSRKFELAEVTIFDTEKIDQYRKNLIKMDHKLLNHPKTQWTVSLTFVCRSDISYYFWLSKDNYGVEMKCTGIDIHTFGNILFYCNERIADLVEKDLKIRK